QTVTVTSGYFNVELGSVDTNLEDVISNGSNIVNKMWLGINVAGDGEMTARQELTSTSFAFVADTLKGIRVDTCTNGQLATWNGGTSRSDNREIFA
ncbi:hypothetical protein MBAV_003672, partial [Candidatus Magnetobacterium bavaricum]